MPLNSSSVQSLRRVFFHSFSAHDITEPLISLEQSVEASEVRHFMEQRKLEVIGVRRAGLVTGYVERSWLGDGRCSDFAKPFDKQHVVLDTTPLNDVVLALNESPRLFVSVFGRIGGIVTRSDLQKPAVRMWLFGMVTLIEMRLMRMIETLDEDWQQYLSEARLQKAEELMAERVRRNQQIELLDCLQFSDKCQIVARNKTLRALTRFESRRQVEDTAKKLERLRNNLAHTQDIISTDWQALLELSEHLDDLLEG